MKKTIVVIGTLVLLMMAFAVTAIYFQRGTVSQPSTGAGSKTGELVRAHSPVMGNEAAKITIVEFLDPACEACRAFAPRVKSMVTASFGQVKLVVRYADFHQGSDRVVRMLAAAHMQGKFWPALEAILEAQPIWASHDNPQPDLVWKYVESIGLDMNKARADAQSEAVTQILKQDRADVAAFKIEKTPSFFVNGTPLVNFGVTQLKDLITSEGRKVYGR